MASMNKNKLTEFIEQRWEQSILPALQQFIRIPNQSPHFDHDWQQNGFMTQAVQLVETWAQQQGLRGMNLQVLQAAGKTPLLLIEIAGMSDKTVLLYGHLDKQPEMMGWDADLGPWKPVLRNNRLYGRGSADDGYAVFAALTAIAALQQQNIPHARCVLVIECCEESGSFDLPYYIATYKQQIGEPHLVICLDSGCGNYEQLWCTTSLRGLVSGELTVKILKEGVHSGVAGGIVPSSFRIIRQLLSRIEDPGSGAILVPEFHTAIPDAATAAAQQMAAALGRHVWQFLPFVPGATPISQDPVELILNNTWRPCLAITGVEGIPALAHAGNTLRPQTSLKLSLRIPPNCNPQQAMKALQHTLEKDPPYGAQVTFTPEQEAPGWLAPAHPQWLTQTVQAASQAYFGKDCCYFGEGGTIPFLGMLSAQFPQAQFVVTGVVGPGANAHGPNEFLEIPTAKKVTACVAHILMNHYREQHHG